MALDVRIPLIVLTLSCCLVDFAKLMSNMYNKISRFGEGQTMVAALKMAGGTSPEGKLAGLKAQ